MFIDQETCLNNQRHKVPRLMDRKVFARIGSLITHEAIDLIIREWNLTKKWALEVEKTTNNLPPAMVVCWIATSLCNKNCPANVGCMTVLSRKLLFLSCSSIRDGYLTDRSMWLIGKWVLSLTLLHPHPRHPLNLHSPHLSHRGLFRIGMKIEVGY